MPRTIEEVKSHKHIGGLTYSITIKTCTDLRIWRNQNPDREELIIDFDLGTSYAVSDTFPNLTAISWTV